MNVSSIFRKLKNRRVKEDIIPINLTIRRDTIPYEESEHTSEENSEEDEEFKTYGDCNQNGHAPKYNTRALLKSAQTYELEKFQKNAMVIFNHFHVDGFPEPRFGTEKDEEILRETFSPFAFEFKVFTDLTKNELFHELRNFMEQDFTDYGCIIVVVMTHGEHNGVLWAKDRTYKEIEILNQLRAFNKPTLATKPRMLLSQACRGKNWFRGLSVWSAEEVTRKDGDISNELYYVPGEADILMFHSTFYGNIALRDSLSGSWFIQILCRTIQKHYASMDFESITAEVRKEIALDKCHRHFNKTTGKYEVYKQMPVMTSSFTRKLYLRQFEEPEKNSTKL